MKPKALFWMHKWFVQFIYLNSSDFLSVAEDTVNFSFSYEEHDQIFCECKHPKVDNGMILPKLNTKPFFES